MPRNPERVVEDPAFVAMFADYRAAQRRRAEASYVPVTTRHTAFSETPAAPSEGGEVEPSPLVYRRETLADRTPKQRRSFAALVAERTKKELDKRSPSNR
jgi:hypothetical protein